MAPEIRTMPVFTYKYPQQGLDPISFSDFDVGPLPGGPWKFINEPSDVERWARLFDDDPTAVLSTGVAPPDILYYPGMNLPAPKRDYGGPMSRYWAEYSGPLPIGESIEISGAITEKFLRRGRGCMTFELVARVQGTVVQKHWRRFALRLADACVAIASLGLLVILLIVGQLYPVKGKVLILEDRAPALDESLLQVVVSQTVPRV